MDTSDMDTRLSKTGRLLKTCLVVGLVSATFAGSIVPSYADGRGGAIAAGIIGGTALGVLAGSAAAGAFAPPPPPPGYYPPPPPPPARYVEPVDAPPPPPRCHRELVRVWDPYAGVYVDRPRRVCDY